MKHYISLIILHCIVLVNDKSFKESLSYTKSKTGIFNKCKPWTNAYYKN